MAVMRNTYDAGYFKLMFAIRRKGFPDRHFVSEIFSRSFLTEDHCIRLIECMLLIARHKVEVEDLQEALLTPEIFFIEFQVTVLNRVASKGNKSRQLYRLAPRLLFTTKLAAKLCISNRYWTWTFVFAGVSAVMVAVLTVSFQAIKAATANPVESLRYE